MAPASRGSGARAPRTEDQAMPRCSIDQLVLNGQSYVFRNCHWTTPNGYRVSTSDGQKLTFAFYEQHGRVPGAAAAPPPVASSPRRSAPAARRAR